MNSHNKLQGGQNGIFARLSGEGADAGGAGWNNQVTRRTFLKRSGGATATTFLAWHLSSLNARADGETSAVSGDSSKTNSVVEFEVTAAINISVYSEKGFWKEFNKAKDAGKLKDLKWSVPIPNPVELDGTIISSPGGATVDFGRGNFTLPVGKYKITVYKTKP